jgi:hypothetical protein
VGRDLLRCPGDLPRSVVTRLEELYAEVPAIRCRGLCANSCHSLGLSNVEQTRIAIRRGVRLETTIYPDGCPALTPFRHCSIYDDRPLMCRLWGVVESMPCPHGCVPDRMLTDREARDLLERLERAT